MHESEMWAVLLAEREITRKLNLYCRASDRCDVELLASVYHEDAYEDHGDTFRGPVKDYIAHLSEMVKQRFVAMHHHLSNIIIDVGGDAARSESAALASMGIPNPDGTYALSTFSVRYIDRWENRPGAGWRIVHRVAVADWQTLQPMVAPEHQPAGYLRGAMDRSDPVYADPPLMRPALADSAVLRAGRAATR